MYILTKGWHIQEDMSFFYIITDLFYMLFLFFLLLFFFLVLINTIDVSFPASRGHKKNSTDTGIYRELINNQSDMENMKSSSFSQ